MEAIQLILILCGVVLLKLAGIIDFSASRVCSGGLLPGLPHMHVYTFSITFLRDFHLVSSFAYKVSDEYKEH